MNVRGVAPFLAAAFLATGAVRAQDCPSPLFVCQTERGDRFIAICATEAPSGEVWTDLQYMLGREGAKAEMVYPVDKSKGASLLYFSHVKRGADYRVSIRFVNAGHTYRVFSHSEPASAGVTVSDASGTLIATRRCGERPHMFSTYMRRSMACDEANPHGRAACLEAPFIEAP